MPKTHDLCVKIGSYESEGKQKNRYLNIGAMFDGEKGKYILLNKTFNPAGVIDERNGQSVIVSMFEIKKESEEKPVSNPEDINWTN